MVSGVGEGEAMNLQDESDYGKKLLRLIVKEFTSDLAENLPNGTISLLAYAEDFLNGAFEDAEVREEFENAFCAEAPPNEPKKVTRKATRKSGG